MSLRTHNDALLRDYPTFVVGTPDNLGHLDASPLGLPIRHTIDPLRTGSGAFLDLLQRLDALTFGPEGMPMDKWVFYDCAELPGFIYGFSLPAAELTCHERRLFELPAGYEGPVPLSMYIAIPMHEPGAWFGHNLASLNPILPERGLHRLGTTTKALALAAFRVEHFFGATQWTSTALHIHTRFGPLELHTAYTPAHSMPETMTYGFRVREEALRAALGDPDGSLDRPEADLWLDAEDVEAMKRLQEDIEAGARYQLVDAPTADEGRVLHPLTRAPGTER